MSELLFFLYVSFGLLFFVMTSTTIYTVEHFLEEKSRKSKRVVKKKPCLKKGKIRRKDKYVRIMEPQQSFDLLSPEEEEEYREHFYEVLKEIDGKLEKYQDLEGCLRTLRRLRKQYPDDPQLLWRIGKAYYRTAEKERDVVTKLTYVDKGIEFCQEAIDTEKNQADAHKWMAISIGFKGQFQDMKQKIKCGKLFKKHLDMAIRLKPSDPVVQHMAGRLCWEIESLSWMEKKIAKSMFPEPLNCSIEIALKHFFEAEKLLGPNEWKVNKLLIAKCFFSKGEYKLALEWLQRAKNAKDDTASELVKIEIEELMKKYSKFIVCQCHNRNMW